LDLHPSTVREVHERLYLSDHRYTTILKQMRQMLEGLLLERTISLGTSRTNDAEVRKCRLSSCDLLKAMHSRL
jgi:hypothetical protein